MLFSVLNWSILPPILDWIVAIDGKNSIGSGAEMSMSFSKPPALGLGRGIAVRGF